ncbi:hypothetical protein F5Y14DRAFT_448070 [Nemania sp. NC0429]|nr:hypothetical protein F5Y14DRAFT_448070 [Nemania sp. NC0429]
MDPNTTPAIPAPPDQTSNLIDPYTTAPQRIAVSVIALLLCVLSVAGRLYTRVLLKKFNLDDCVLVLSATLFAAFTAIALVATKYGDGKHLWNVSQADFEQDLFLENLLEILYGPTMFTIKYVILNQIAAIFFDHHRRVIASRFIQGLILINFLFFFSITIAFALACTPREKIWKPQIDGYCIDTKVLVAVGSSFNVVSDITIFLTPIAALSKLQLAVKKKLRAATVFAVGILAIVASVLRLYYGLWLFWTIDITWAISPVGQWTIAEFSFGYLIAASPYLPRLFTHMRGIDKFELQPSFNNRSYHSGGKSVAPTRDGDWEALTSRSEEGVSREVPQLNFSRVHVRDAANSRSALRA